MKLLTFNFKKLLNYKRLISNIIIKQKCFLRNYFVALSPKVLLKLFKLIVKFQNKNFSNISSIKGEFVMKLELKTPF